MSAANFRLATDLFPNWSNDILTGELPVLYPVGTGDLERIEVGPGLVTLLGGGPGAGKTALAMQWVVDALRLTPSLRALVCNVEMGAPALLDRQLARLSGIDLTTIRYRRFGQEHGDRLDQGIATLSDIGDRLCFLSFPFNLDNVANSADEFQPSLLLLDYIQRIPPPGEHGDRRGAVDATMDHLRHFAAAGTALIVVSAVGRGKDKSGRSSYESGALSLASFRESSELEFGADSAFIVAPMGGHDNSTVVLRHLKDRYGSTRDLSLTFDRPRQSFTAATLPKAAPKPNPQANGARVAEEVSSLWGMTPSKDDEETE